MVSDKQFSKVEDERQWEAIQTKTFQGWVNMHLEKIQDRVNNLETDLSDGVKLIRLLEVLNGSSIEGRYYKNPKSRPYKIDNINFALNFITDTLQVKLIGCSAEDIVDGNLKIILGMLWRLIQKFQLSTDNISRQSLLTWCRKVTEDRANVNIENFHKSFQDGLAFCAIISAISSELIDFASLAQSESLQNLNVAFNIGEEQFDIPKLLDPIDVSSGHVDERSIMTYVSMWHKAYTDKLKPKKLSAPSEGSSSKSASDSAPLSARGEGANLQQEIATLKAQNAELRKQLDAARENLRAAKAESEANANQVAALQSTLEALEKKHKETLQELENAKASSKNESAESQPAGESSSAAPAEVKKEEVKEEKKEEVKEEVKEVKVEKEKAPEAEKPVSPKDDQSASKVESLSKELEEAKEEIALLSKKYKKQQEKAIKKQQKRYEKTIKKKDRELDKLQTSTTAELRAKDEEIKTLLAELKKAQKTIGAAAASSSEEAGQKPIDKDYEFLKSEYEDLLQIAQILEEDEKSMSKKYTKRADGEGAEGDDGAETETEGEDK